MSTELNKRWQTALIALPVLFFIVYWLPAFLTLVLVATLICLYEFYGIVLKDIPVFHGSNILGFILSPLWIMTLYMGHAEYLWMIVVFHLFMLAIISVCKYNKSPDIIDTMIRQLIGLIYISGLLSFLVLIRQFEQGHLWIYLTFLMIFACDTGGYFVGKQFGKTPLCPAVSPKKTIEGFLGGCLLCIIVCIIFVSLTQLPMSIGHMLCMSTIIGLIAPFGDLFESVLKRVSHIKDSGHILPGHGGILDRIDALMFAGPLIYAYKTLFIG